jgi:hypothetical protein
MLYCTTNCLRISKELQIKDLYEEHDSAVGRLRGIDQMVLTVSRWFFWLCRHQTVKQYLKGYAACHQAMSNNQKSYGLLQPWEVLSERWQRINIDFITKLPVSDVNDTIITFVDDQTTRATWMATTEKDLIGQNFAEIFINMYFPLHGIPELIVSDRGIRFTSDFWQHMN